MRNQKVANGLGFGKRALRALALSGVCIAVLAAWQPWSRAASEFGPIGSPTPGVHAFVGGSYRDKHGNEGTITLGSPVVNSGVSGIDYTVPYTLTDSEGDKSGEYIITSEMLPGRDAPNSDDFVLNVFVSDDASQNAAQLVFRNNSNEAPIAPILRLLDCSSPPCTVDKTYDNDEWGCWIIQDQSDIADYPIELLDARVITKLLEPAQLSQLPAGNWADIMENHTTNFVEAKFRADIDHLGATQSQQRWPEREELDLFRALQEVSCQ